MIEHQLTTLTLSLTVLLLSINERKRLNTIVTPFTVTAFPFVVIAILVNFLLVYLDFKPFTMRAQLFVLVNLIILWLIGYLMAFFQERKGAKDTKQVILENPIATLAKYDWIVIIISWIAVAVIYQRVSQLFGRFGGFAFLGDPRFEKMMMRGVAAHMGEVAKVCFILLGIFWSYSHRKPLLFVTMIAIILGVAALQVKYHLLWVLIMLFMYKILDWPVKKQARAIIWTGITVIGVMNLFWILLTIAWKTFSLTSKGIWQFLFEHTMLYITSAPIALDRWLDFADIKPENSLLVVLLNVINVLIGNPERISAMPYITIGFVNTAHKMISNVGTAYGVYYIIGGWPLTIFMTVLLSWVYYLIFYANRRKTNMLLIFFNIFCLTLAALTFFGLYFTFLSFYEIILVYIIVLAILRILHYLKTGIYAVIFKTD